MRIITLSYDVLWQMRTEDYQYQSGVLQQQIAMMEAAKHSLGACTDEHGPPVSILLRKGPCRATSGKHSTVTVVLSANIGQAISLEDDIYDHFYSYK